jgi:DNA-binding LacI/PurR family transcriptional regulator
MIGIVIPYGDNTFFSSLSQALYDLFAEKGMHPCIYLTGADGQREKEILAHMPADCQGVLLVSCQEKAGAYPYPIVYLDSQPESGEPLFYAGNDDRQAIDQAASCLIDLGCRHLVLFPGCLKNEAREKGFADAVRRHPDVTCRILHRQGKDRTEIEVEKMLLDLLEQQEKVDGIICSSDRAMFGANRALQEAGYYIPEDVKLVSFDNSCFAALATPSYTAIDRNVQALAKGAAELLEAAMRKEPAKKIIVPGTIVHRYSTR